MKFEMKLLEEAGYAHAIRGLAKNKKQKVEGMGSVAQRLAKMDGGHNKFLESMQVWLEINAPRYWWQEFDTYRVGVTKQSESTMHTLTDDDLDNGAVFEPGVNPVQIEYVRSLIGDYHREVLTKTEKLKLFLMIKANLPEGFMQCRVVNLNYKSLRNIYAQRRKHRLPHWQQFCDSLLRELEFPEFISGTNV